MNKRLRIALLILLIPLLAAGIGIGWLCYTASGLQFALLQLNRLPSLDVSVQGVRGRLAGPLHVDHLQLEHERASIVVEQLDVDFTPAFLFSGLIEVNLLKLQKLSINLKPKLRDQPDKPIHFVPGILRISIDELLLEDAQYVHTNGYTVRARPLRAEASLSRSQLQLRNLSVLTEDFDARGEVTLNSVDTWLTALAKLDTDYRLSSGQPSGQVLRGDLQATGPVTGAAPELKIQLAMREPHIAKIDGTLSFGSAWNIAGNATADQVLLDAWWNQPTFSLGQLTAQYRIDAAGMHFVGDARVPEWSPAPLHFDTDMYYAQRVLTIRRADVSVPQTSVSTHTTGTIALQSEGKPLLDLNGNWTALRWPLHADNQQAWFTSSQGTMQLQGAGPYQYSVDGQVLLPVLPASLLQAKGELSPTLIRLDSYELRSLQGRASGKAQLAINQRRDWQFELRAQGINPVQLLPEWPGNLSVNASARGAGLSPQAQFDLQIKSLTGTLRNQSINAHGRVRRSADEWRADDLTASWGRTRLSAQGSFGAQSNLRWILNAPDLQQLYAPLSGEVNMTGNFSGSRAEPLLNLQLQSARLAYQQWSGQQLDVDAHIDITDRSNSTLALTAQRLAFDDMALQQVKLEGSGQTGNHELTLSAGVALSPLPDDLHLQLQLAGAYVDEQWRGSLNQLQFTDAQQAIRGKLQTGAPVLLARTQASLQSLCLDIDSGTACATGAWNPGAGPEQGWQLHASLQNLPLSISNSAFIESARLQTRLQGQVDLSAQGSAPWQGTASLNFVDASIRYQSVAGREQVLPLREAEVQMVASAQDVKSAAELRIGEQTVITLSTKLERNNDAITAWPLSGVLALSSSDAKLIPVFVSEVDRADGTLAGLMQLSGTAGAPRFAGDLHLLGGELDFYQLNLALRALQVDMQMDNDQLAFTAQGNAGEGLLNASGDLAWREAKLRGTLQLKGNKLLVADLPEYRVLASPDLRFDINDRNINVKGEVVIPEARLQPKEVVGAVQTSADAHFKTDEVFERNSGWNINSEVSIRLGDAVQFDGLGLQGRLTGAVATRLRTGDVAEGSGELGTNGGSYEIYGQKLDIKRGRLIYDNTPLGDPGLDIQAERKINTTTVGVNVRGLLRSPRLQFYSSPSMSQTQIVSYLLIGKPLDELQTGEATTVRSASSTLALQGGGYLASQLGRRIGLEQVGVETDANNQSALVLGKFLSPRLFVSYGISLTEAINTVKLRYTLSDRWTIKTEAGAAKSADIEFKVER